MINLHDRFIVSHMYQYKTYSVVLFLCPFHNMGLCCILFCTLILYLDFSSLIYWNTHLLGAPSMLLHIGINLIICSYCNVFSIMDIFLYLVIALVMNIFTGTNSTKVNNLSLAPLCTMVFILNKLKFLQKNNISLSIPISGNFWNPTQLCFCISLENDKTSKKQTNKKFPKFFKLPPPVHSASRAEM